MIDEFGGDFFQWLRGFYYVATTGSVSLAASKMGRNQPAISHQIKCLESEFGVTVFDRSKGTMELTLEGRKVLDMSISIFEIIKQMKAEIGKNNYTISGTISIATTHAVIRYYLADQIIRFRKHYPDVNFKLTGGGFNYIVDQIESSEVDFGIAYINAINDGKHSYTLFSSVPVLIAPKKGSYVIDKTPSLKKLSEFPFILFPEYSTLVKSVRNVFKAHHLSIKVIMTLNNVDIIKKYVELGMGVSIIEGFAIEEKDKEKLNIYSLDEYLESRAYGVFLRRRKYLSPGVKIFLKYISNQS